jgi:hypothetical protein
MPCDLGNVRSLQRFDSPDHDVWTPSYVAVSQTSTFVWHRLMRRKRTTASSLLRRIMVKFIAVDETMKASSWGPPYIGGQAPLLTREEERLRESRTYHASSCDACRCTDA